MIPRRIVGSIWLAVALAAAACGRPAVDGAAPEDPKRAAILRFWASLDEATKLRTSGRFAQAADAYERTLGLDPRHEDSLYYLGHCRREGGDLAGARQAFARLVEVNPASARGHLALAAALAAPGAAEPPALHEAESHLRRAHDINGEETGPMVRLAEVLIVQGRTAEARDWLEAAARTNPRSLEAAFLAGYLRWEEGDRAGALAWLERGARAARSEAPPKGVLGEGDRRAATPGPVAAPPLRDPMGRTLFSELAAPLREAGATPTVALADTLYRAVREARRAMAAPRPTGGSVAR